MLTGLPPLLAAGVYSIVSPRARPRWASRSAPARRGTRPRSRRGAGRPRSCRRPTRWHPAAAPRACTAGRTRTTRTRRARPPAPQPGASSRRGFACTVLSHANGRDLMGGEEDERVPGSRSRAVRPGAGRVRRSGRGGHGRHPRERARDPEARGRADHRALRALPPISRDRALLPGSGRDAGPRRDRPSQAQPRPLAARDRRGRADPRFRLLPALGRPRPQPPRLRAGRKEPSAVHGGRDEPRPRPRSPASFATSWTTRRPRSRRRWRGTSCCCST